MTSNPNCSHRYKLIVWKTGCEVCKSAAVTGSARCVYCNQYMTTMEVERRVNFVEQLVPVKVSIIENLIYILKEWKWWKKFWRGQKPDG